MAVRFKACLVDGCNGNSVKPGSGLGYCGKHYQRLKKHGDPLKSLYDRENAGGICKADECSKPATACGYCQKHYLRWKKYGDASAHHERYLHVRSWVERHAHYEGDECLKWPFGVNDTGRGKVTVEGKAMSAPRAMCLLAHGEPPTPQHEAAHSCGKGHEGCVNPRHLSWKTTSENRMDMADHGTLPRGEAVNTAKLTKDQVREIRRIGSRMDRKDIASMFGVAPCTVWEIQTRRSWAWLDG